MAVAGVGQHEFAGHKAEPPKLLPHPLAAIRGEFEVIALQRRQPKTVMKPPLAAGLARLTHCGRIQKPHWTAHQAVVDPDAVLPPQPLTKLPQPPLRITQPV